MNFALTVAPYLPPSIPSLPTSSEALGDCVPVQHRGSYTAIDSFSSTPKIPKPIQKLPKPNKSPKIRFRGVHLSLNPETLETRLLFSKHYELNLYPNPLDEDELQHWVLFMPSEQVLAIGPGYHWSCRSIRDRL